MDDAEYIFRQEIREKKSTGRGSFHKKCGSKSKKCTLPSDFLTRKEKAAMNSEITSWSLGTFYDYDTFKKMPDDIQIEYLQSLTDKWQVGCSSVSEILFKSPKNTLSSYLTYRGMDGKIQWKGHTGMKARVYNQEFRKAIWDALGGPIKDDAANDMTTSNLPEVANEAADDIFVGKVSNSSITLDGFDKDTFEWLAQKYYGRPVTVTIIVESK